MPPFLKHTLEPELLDQPGLCTQEEIVGSLRGIERVNVLLNGSRLTVQRAGALIERAAMLRRATPIRICDIGTGSADIPRALVRWARKIKLPIQITAVEMNPDFAENARALCDKYPEITIITADAREILRAAARGQENGHGSSAAGSLQVAEPFDVVTACLFLHHFAPREVSSWLALMHEAARVGWVVNDLERHILAWLGIKAVGPLMCRNRVFLNDAPLSVRRAYTPAEWKELGESAGIKKLRVSRHWGWRVVLEGRR